MSGLTSAGFVPKRLDEIRDELEASLKAALGANLQVGADSVVGVLIGIFAERESDLWELMERLFSAGTLGGATESALDDLAALVGVVRPGPTRSVAVLTLGGTPAASIPAGSTSTDANGISWIHDDTVILDGGGAGTTTASPSEVGPIEGASGTINEIGTPVTGWTTVTNAEDADLGRLAYSDSALRTLIRLTNRTGGGATADGLRALLLRLDDVTEAEVIWNDSDYPDTDGRPGHSFEAVVRGGDDQQIAETIWSAKPNGIATFGDETDVVVDAAGDNQNVNWSRPEDVNVYVEIDYTPTDGFPEDGEALIEEAILDYGSSFVLGQDVIAFQIVQHIEVPGILDLEIRIGKLASPSTDSPITITRKQLADFDSSRITIAEI
jgi:uncharacterized phage protein gp47/JayE